jgi:hypothetical protein
MRSQSASNDRSPQNPKSLGVAAGRRAFRFPVTLPVRYQIGGELGWGELVNISSSGALFTTERALVLGRDVELWINWPARLWEAVHLKLVAEGPIVRVEPGRAALNIVRHEFRTSSSSFLWEASTPERPSNRVTVQASSIRGSHLQVQVANQAMQRVRM